MSKVGTAFGSMIGPYGPGVAWTTDTTATGIQLDVSKAIQASDLKFSIVAGIKKSDTAGDYDEIYSGGGSGTSKPVLRCNSNGSLAMVTPGVGDIYSTSAGIVTASESFVLGCAWQYQNYTILSKNGRTVGSGTGGNNYPSAWSSSTIGSSQGGSYQGRKSIYFLIAWEWSLLNEAQLNTATARWAELLSPYPRRLFFDIGAGGGTTTVNSDSVGLYDVLGLVQSDCVSLFDMAGMAQSDMRGLFDVLGLIVSDSTAKFDILNKISSNSIAFFDVQATVQGDLVLLFDLRNMTASDLIALYDMGGTVRSDVQILFDIDGGVMAVHIGRNSPYRKVFQQIIGGTIFH